LDTLFIQLIESLAFLVLFGAQLVAAPITYDIYSIKPMADDVKKTMKQESNYKTLNFIFYELRILRIYELLDKIMINN
jgi:flagellar motor component MotA